MKLHSCLDVGTVVVVAPRSQNKKSLECVYVHTFIQKLHKNQQLIPGSNRWNKGTGFMLQAKLIMLFLSSRHRENASFLPGLSTAAFIV